MAFSDFTLDQLETQFGVINRIGQLFEPLQPLEPSERLRELLAVARELLFYSEISLFLQNSLVGRKHDSATNSGTRHHSATV